jgi:hypothetical protein
LVGTAFLAALAGVFILEASKSKGANKANGRAIVACLCALFRGSFGIAVLDGREKWYQDLESQA